MTRASSLVALSLAVLVAAAGTSFAKGSPKGKAQPVAPAPMASQVVVRRQTSLADAFRVAIHPAKALGPAAGIAIVVDPTPDVRAAKQQIADALAALGADADRPTTWQVGALGGTLSAPVKEPSALEPALSRALAGHGPDSPDTLGMLRKTVRRAAGPTGVVVYLAHVRFEDAVDLEGFVAELRAAKRTLCVIGPEAAFERAWRDVLPTIDEILRDSRETIPGVGTSPFQPDDPETPWKGGDTAYPLMPYLFDTTARWDTAFHPPFDPAKALRSKDPLAGLGPRVALPSGFGPYGLMRAAGVTGGRYVLWGWGASDVPPQPYDYARCDLFAPDLRARSEILVDLPKRTLALALMQAWNRLATDGCAAHSPPWADGEPRPLRRTSGTDLWLLGVFEKPADRDDSVAAAKAGGDAIARVTKELEDRKRSAGEPKDDVDRRLSADADLLLFALRTIRLRIDEYVAWSESLTPKAWRVKRSRSPSVEGEAWIRPGEDDPAVDTEEIAMKDPAACAAYLDARRAFLERYRGTPFGAMVTKNAVTLWKIDTIDLTATGGGGDLPKPGKGSSTGPSAPPPSGGSSGTPGPTTGK